MRGLYLITNDDPIELLLAKLEGAMATYEVAVLQYRRKKVPKQDQDYEIEYMKSMCAQYKVPFVINDDLDAAIKYGVGVHLGQGDGSIVEAVARLPKGVLVGRSCNNSIELAEQAIADGANYVAFGAIYATDTKPEAGNIGLDTLKQAKAKFDVPICAIGGLTVENSAPVIEAGADLCAVISDILGRTLSGVTVRTQEWADLFTAHKA
ncbi:MULTISPECIES: thiamine phosphate synthase [Acinetobacter]|jgi:thiamine-phosphate pyrophosphorylase|uniref:thiamine phosphate synthase n=1 Tax=Acinetobacter TaxID=469 RepID=UPI00057423CA|nr:MULTISPECIES: thiamine phosphate synthase [Acinetobacter]KKW76253.1 thiamine-phosphate pyrophosphorylase [Acinetobacter sp. Ag2]MCU4417733.1 thiamine phosphate synthase [Acinetobacter bereziniae]MCU4435318.1 thiamine phosphate synthase [Acinetobacter bereziniae]MCU4536163.1 thiamine phosphate synthase [Acinetobacter bereziniae]RSZ25786.1 thiamine phosphate synthase [Acinetobacter bereziniae]